ncbi:AF4/FMR2 family member lilli [Topomyia yanbarensis]|uniref:AF4/FMR2 family member lilli n=1 Tax=Topomyia yanbarensis TaxID=2498891 RepID=UPI00273B8731|nr:AF4/FMR2 family member lilli [Topomyia yanbarensis]
MSESISMDLQSSMLLETLRQTPSIPEHHQKDSGGSGLTAGDEKIKGNPSSSLSSADSGGGGSCGITPDSNNEKSAFEAMDPAILSATAPSESETSSGGEGCSEKVNWTRYSVNQLLALRNVELSKKKPTCIVEPKSEKHAKMFSLLVKPSETANEEENAGNGTSANYGRNRTVYSSANGAGTGGGNGPSSGGNGSGGSSRAEMRRSGGVDLRDPKERLRKEDGIVLSPQRRSFNMGCQMPAAPATGTSNLTIGSSLLRNERDILGGRERRIGSGRILSRDVSWDYRPDKDVVESNDYRTSNNLGFRDREPRERTEREKDFRKDFDRDREREREREERFERRSINRDYDRNEKDSRSSRVSRYSNSYGSNNDSHGNNNYHSNSYSSNNHYHSNHHDRRRQYSDNRDEEPEWFSEPTSQTDTIELRGFDDPLPEDDSKSDNDNNSDESKSTRQDTKHTEKDTERASPSLQNDKNNNPNTTSDALQLGSTDKPGQGQGNSSLAPSADSTQQDRTPGDGASEGSAKAAIGSTVGVSNALGQSNKIADDDFNFEDFLKLDALPSSLLYPDIPSKESGSTGGSRFSQWFRQDTSQMPTGQQQQQQQQKQQQPPSQFDSRRSSLQDDINNMINDFTSAGLDDHIPDTNSNKYFAPISPAASTSSNSLLELFQRGEKQQHQRDRENHQQHQPTSQHQQQQQQQQQQHAHSLMGGHNSNHPAMQHTQQQQPQQQHSQQQHHQQMQNRNLQQMLGVTGGGNIGGHGSLGPVPAGPNVGQIHSVEELEARFRQNDVDSNVRSSANTGPTIPRLITPSSGNIGGGLPANVDQQHEREMNAFKKLLASITDNQHGQHAHNVQPPTQPPSTHSSHHQSHPVNMLHHQQQQNDLLQKMLHLNQMHHPANESRQLEILKRPEAQALLHGVARGEVSQHNLWQQLANPATAQPHREILSSVLSTFNTSPRVVSPNILIQPSPGPIPILPQATVPPVAAAAAAAAAASSANLLFQHHSKQQMRLSPLPNGIPQRIPSPRELQFHTQSIMQNALIRKKLEEQRENYRKRQEQQQQQQQQQNRNQPEASSAAGPTTSAPTNAAISSMNASSTQTGIHSSNSSTATATVAASTGTITTPAIINAISSPAKHNQQPLHSHSQHTSSPTPLAFTPTSVLRKMTAEKENEPLSSNSNAVNIMNNSGNAPTQLNERPLIGANQNPNILLGIGNSLSQQQQQQQQRNLSALIGQPPPLQPPPSQPQGPPPQLPSLHHLGGGHLPNPIAPQMPPQQQQQPQPSHQQQMRGNHPNQQPGMPGNIPWNLKQPHPGQQMPSIPKPQGRPILKGGNAQPQPPPQHTSPMSQMSFASNLEFQQQMQQFQSRSGNPILGAHQTPQQQMLQQQQQHGQHQNQMAPHLQQLLQQRQQQQQRAIRNQHMQQVPPSFRMGPQQQSQPGGPGQHPLQGPQQPQQQQPPPPQQGGSGIINYNRDGALSPTSNQLARWFSPELLAQASAGKLPSLNIGQAMSLEEFERNMQHSSATVHN